MNPGPSNGLLETIAGAIVITQLVSLRHGRPAEGWPFVILMLALALNIATSPLTASITPVIPIALSIVIIIGLLLAFPRVKNCSPDS